MRAPIRCLSLLRSRPGTLHAPLCCPDPPRATRRDSSALSPQRPEGRSCALPLRSLQQNHALRRHWRVGATMAQEPPWIDLMSSSTVRSLRKFSAVNSPPLLCALPSDPAYTSPTQSLAQGCA